MLQEEASCTRRQPASIMRLDEALAGSSRKLDTKTTIINKTTNNRLANQNNKRRDGGLLEASRRASNKAVSPANSMQKLSSMGEAVRNSMSRLLANVGGGSQPEPEAARSGRPSRGNHDRNAAVRMFANRNRQHPLSRSMERSNSSRFAADRLPATGGGGGLLKRSLSVQQPPKQLRQPATASSSLRQSARKCCNCISSKRLPFVGAAGQQRRGLNLAGQAKQPKWLTKTSWVLFVLLALVVCEAMPVFDQSQLAIEPAPSVSLDNSLLLADLVDPSSSESLPESDQQVPLALVEQAAEETEDAEEETGGPLLLAPVEGQPEEEGSESFELQQQLGQQNGDSLWIERRRLERDRALEPPSWLRDQPMRRASSEPLAPSTSGEDEQQTGKEEEPADQIVRLAGESGDPDIKKQVYEEIKVRVGSPDGVIERQGSFLLSSDSDGQLRLSKLELAGDNSLPVEQQQQQPESELSGNGEAATILRNIMKRAFEEPAEEEEATVQETLEALPAVPVKEPERFAVSHERLALMATKLKSYLEDELAIPRASILGLYPLNARTLLIKLNVEMLNRAQLVNMVQNYDFARGFVGASWPLESKENPMPLLRAIMRAWVITNPETLTDVFDRFEEFSAQHQSNQQQSEQGQEQEERLSESELGQALNAQPEALPLTNLNAGKLEEAPPTETFGQLLVDDGRQLEEQKRRAYLLENGQPIATTINRFAPIEQTQAAYRPPAGHLLPAADRLLLAEYLSALYASPTGLARASALVLPAASFANQKQAPQLLIKNQIGQNKALVGGEGSSGKSWWAASKGLLKSPQVVYLFALIAGLLATCLTIKLVILKKLNSKESLRREFSRFGHQTSSSLKSLWSFSRSNSTISGELVGKPSSEQENKAACFENNKNLDTMPEEDFNSSKKTKSLDLLTQRLVDLLRNTQKRQRKVHPGKVSKGAKLEDDYQIENEEEEEEDGNQTEEEGPEVEEFADCERGRGHFRSSRSYIKSLIEVLSNAKSHISSVPTFRTTKPSDSNLVEDLEGELKQQEAVEEFVCEPGIAVSQMDISAAHLILAYMERHLEDKERLRREWLELNGQRLTSTGTSGKKLSKDIGDSKQRQLLLQRLAKVALSEENRSKNRNPLVVPFDRNRVRLFSSCLSRSPSSSSSTSGAVSKLTNKTTRSATAKDYINASYIHDDDHRKPTHIIAQGPCEQNVGQFWQMIWEQGVSVIVMLTRLNENGQRACHCYWPTSGQAVQVAGGSSAQPEVANQPDESPKQTPVCRRGSVTSVFEATSGKTINGVIDGGAIIKNGELTNNMLVFDVSCSESSSLEEELEEVDQQSAESTADRSRLRGKTGRIRFEVHLVSEHVSSKDYLVRNMYIINRSNGETRTISQFHYLAWPKNGVPSNVRSLLAFRRKVHKSYRDLASPILVHSSDGAGRSGTYALIDIILERIKNGAKEIDPRATLEHLRDQRVGLCSTQSQFEFVLVALAEEIQMILNALPR